MTTDQSPPATELVFPRILHIFISYAHEDEKIALAVFNALNKLLCVGGLCQVTFDKYSFEIGERTRDEIETKLEAADILIIIYTGVDKPSHSYTGYELGFFAALMRQEVGRDIPRKIVSLYLHTMPAVTADTLGIKFDITRENLLATEAAFRTKLAGMVNDAHPLVSYLRKLQSRIEQEATRMRLAPTERDDPKVHVEKMLLEIYGSLKGTVDEVHKPQKQLIVRTVAGSLAAKDTTLPPSATLTPVGEGNVMEIFGLPDAPITWAAFEEQVDQGFGPTWCEAINSVIISSLPNTLEIDNGQILASRNGKHFYRLILTTGTTYFNGDREFNLYIVEKLNSPEYGSETTTRLLNGLKIVCLYRFMFLEPESEFNSYRLTLPKSAVKLGSVARNLHRALNILRQAGEDAGLDDPVVWTRYVTWSAVTEMANNWMPLEEKLREIAGKILQHERAGSERTALIPLRDELIETLKKVAASTQVHNRLLINEMTAKLRAIIDSDKPVSTP